MARFIAPLLLATTSCVAAKDVKFLAKSNATNDRLGSFLVIGDWGFDDASHIGHNIPDSQCQNDVSSLLEQTFESLSDVKFVLNLGDSFYISGVKGVDDPRWEQTWRKRYSDALRNVPWYSIYGNHDYGEESCACRDSEDQCAQTQYKTDGWYMPNLNFNKIHSDLNLEVIALDTNNYWAGQIKKYIHTCSEDKVLANLAESYKQAMDLLRARLADETGPSRVLIISHYPTTAFSGEMTDLIKQSKKDITVYGGHIHTTASCESSSNCEGPLTPTIAPQRSYLVGGGGGYYNFEHDGAAKFGIMAGIVSSDSIENQPYLITKDQCTDQCIPGAESQCV